MDKVLRILILEDRGSDADLMEFELLDAGLAFTSRRATNEKTFRRELERFSPDLILSDYDLPQYTGVRALMEAKARFHRIPFILVTGALGNNDTRIGEIIKKGASDCIFKSALHQLSPAVHKALEKAGRENWIN